jgi:hypothetical protein
MPIGAHTPELSFRTSEVTLHHYCQHTYIGKYALLNNISSRVSLDLSSLAAAAADGISARSSLRKWTSSFPVSPLSLVMAASAFDWDLPATYTLARC